MKRNEDNFNADLPAGYDGHFEWDCFKNSGCWGDTKIEPMDFDGVVERKKNYLIFETKDQGKDVPKGQQITLDHLNDAKTFTVVKLWPKRPPFETCEIAHHTGKTEVVTGHEAIIEKVRRWYYWADGTPYKEFEDKCTVCGLQPATEDGMCEVCYDAEQGWPE